jgi:hypothetical protein
MEQLDIEVYVQVPSSARSAVNRYFAGSLSDARSRKPNWNLAFEIPAVQPKGAVLLLHGLTDSPWFYASARRSLCGTQLICCGPATPWPRHRARGAHHSHLARLGCRHATRRKTPEGENGLRRAAGDRRLFDRRRAGLGSFDLTVLGNAGMAAEGEGDAALVARHRAAQSVMLDTRPIEMTWPRDIYSLAHISLPFRSDDPMATRIRIA